MNGWAQDWYMYQPFGETSQSKPSFDNWNRFRFTGREADETGLYYYRARYYAPDLGRFISEDPAGLDELGNQYAYAGNDPVDGSDPTGLIPTKVVRPRPRRNSFLDGLFSVFQILDGVFGDQNRTLDNEAGPPRTRRGVIRSHRLPANGRFRYVPPKSWRPTVPLPRGPGGRGFVDKFGNIWQQGPPHHFPDDPFQWDVQLKSGGYVNVSQRGVIR